MSLNFLSKLKKKCSCSLGSQSLNDDLDSDDVDNLNYLNESSNTNDTNNGQDNEDEEDESWMAYFKQTLKSQAYNLSGLERFKIQPKKPKYV